MSVVSMTTIEVWLCILMKNSKKISVRLLNWTLTGSCLPYNIVSNPLFWKCNKTDVKPKPSVYDGLEREKIRLVWINITHKVIVLFCFFGSTGGVDWLAIRNKLERKEWTSNVKCIWYPNSTWHSNYMQYSHWYPNVLFISSSHQFKKKYIIVIFNKISC